MTHVEAIFRGGMFQPLEPVNLPEEQRVQLSIEPVNASGVDAWLEEVRAMQAAVLQRRGPVPNSTIDIATDRRR